MFLLLLAICGVADSVYVITYQFLNDSMCRHQENVVYVHLQYPSIPFGSTGDCESIGVAGYTQLVTSSMTPPAQFSSQSGLLVTNWASPAKFCPNDTSSLDYIDWYHQTHCVVITSQFLWFEFTSTTLSQRLTPVCHVRREYDRPYVELLDTCIDYHYSKLLSRDGIPSDGKSLAARAAMPTLLAIIMVWQQIFI